MAIENYISHDAPFGEAMPAGNPHAVSVSMPTRRDVQRLFRDHDPAAWAALETTYPRFGEHPFIRSAVDLRPAQEGRVQVALSSAGAAEQLLDDIPPTELLEPAIAVDGPMTFLSFQPGTAETMDILTVAKKVAGDVPSSRRAEDFLIERGALAGPFREKIEPEADEASVARDLRAVYAPAEPEVILANSGMSAVAATVETLDKIRNEGRGDNARDTWILLGNLYRDTEDLILSRYSGKTCVVADTADMDGLKERLEGLGDRVIGVITEAPTNPLMDIPDLEQAKEALGDIPLVVDVSSAGSMLVDALPHADAIVESLTKFASGYGDIMMGSVAINPEGKYASELKGMLPRRVQPPYGRDVQRIAHELAGWQERALRIGQNTLWLADFFEGHPKIKRTHWAGGSRAEHERYTRIARRPLVPPGLIAIDIKRSARPTYDALNLSKGPSFGTSFTLNTDFVGIVYPHDIGDKGSREMLRRRTGLSPNMIRVSVGTEDPFWLIDRYERALSS